MNTTEIFLLTHNRFNTYMVLIFNDEKEARTHEKPSRYSKHRELEKLVKVVFLIMFKTDDKSSFLFETEGNTFVNNRNNVLFFNTKDGIVNFNSKFGMNDVKFAFAHGERIIFFIWITKYTSQLQCWKTRILKKKTNSIIYIKCRRSWKYMMIKKLMYWLVPIF